MEVIRDLAKAFNTTYDESCGIYFLKIPEKIGEGTIKGINFDGGLGILIYDCKFLEELEIKFIVNDIHPLKFLYCLEGNLLHGFENETDLNTLSQYQNTIVASKNYDGHILKFMANIRTNIGSLEINREDFQHKMDCELRDLTPNLQKLFRDKTAKEPFYYNGFFSLHAADIFREIESFEHNNFIKRIFLEGKAYKILTHQIIQYQDDQKEANSRSLFRSSELTLIDKAARIIEDEISDIDTIETIAERVGLNVNKLQEGFKHLYNLTVNGYVQKTRLELAKTLLLSTDLNISEIVTRVGLSSKSYFSKIFKENYLISPSDFRKKNKDALKKYATKIVN